MIIMLIAYKAYTDYRRPIQLLRVSDVAFAERVMGQPTASDNYRGYDVSRLDVHVIFRS